MDCYTTELPRHVSLAEYIEAFYTTWVFRLERFVLRWLISKPSTDTDAKLLAEGSRDTFAAWRVEGRAADQLLMCDYQQKTRSWFMTAPGAGRNASGTCLYFGSGIVPSTDPRTGESRLSPGFRWLIGFHRMYSRVLLRAAAARLLSTR